MCCCCCFFFSREAVKTSPNLAHEMAGQTMAKGIFGQQKKTKKMGKGAYSSFAENNWQLCHAFTFLMGWHERNPREIDNIRSKKTTEWMRNCVLWLIIVLLFPTTTLISQKDHKATFFPIKISGTLASKNNPKLLLCLFPTSPRGIFCGEIQSRCRISFFNGG